MSITAVLTEEQAARFCDTYDKVHADNKYKGTSLQALREATGQLHKASSVISRWALFYRLHGCEKFIDYFARDKRPVYSEREYLQILEYALNSGMPIDRVWVIFACSRRKLEKLCALRRVTPNWPQVEPAIPPADIIQKINESAQQRQRAAKAAQAKKAARAAAKAAKEEARKQAAAQLAAKGFTPPESPPSKCKLLPDELFAAIKAELRDPAAYNPRARGRKPYFNPLAEGFDQLPEAVRKASRDYYQLLEQTYLAAQRVASKIPADAGILERFHFCQALSLQHPEYPLRVLIIPFGFKYDNFKYYAKYRTQAAWRKPKATPPTADSASAPDSAPDQDSAPTPDSTPAEDSAPTPDSTPAEDSTPAPDSASVQDSTPTQYNMQTESNKLAELLKQREGDH